ncbi:hypothetical protein C8R47DRAFT_1217566 [Mycena vitilis]|nr:hypothetical protein C8R47DRAFT_1217566 [Mycena vitilis]
MKDRENTILVYNSNEYWASFEECELIKDRWRTRDRSLIRSYPQFLAARGKMEARLACSNAIANRLSALRPHNFAKWIRGERTPYQNPNTGTRRLYALETDTGPRDEEEDQVIVSQRPGNRGGGWGENGGWGNGDPWGGGWASGGWGGGGRDPEWDGVTLVPKTPGKKKRCAARERQRNQDLRDAAADFHRRWEEFSHVQPVWNSAIHGWQGWQAPEPLSEEEDLGLRLEQSGCSVVLFLSRIRVQLGIRPILPGLGPQSNLLPDLSSFLGGGATRAVGDLLCVLLSVPRLRRSVLFPIGL